jgi:hypothetical protein
MEYTVVTETGFLFLHFGYAARTAASGGAYRTGTTLGSARILAVLLFGPPRSLIAPQGFVSIHAFTDISNSNHLCLTVRLTIDKYRLRILQFVSYRSAPTRLRCIESTVALVSSETIAIDTLQ